MVEKEISEKDKVIAETKALQWQSSKTFRFLEFVKAFSGLGGIVAAIVAILGLNSSLSRMELERVEKRKADIAQQINHSIGLLADTNPAKRVAGVASLDVLIRHGDGQTKKQIFSVLANILSVENNSLVRDAIVSAVVSSDLQQVDNDIKISFLEQLVSISKSLVKQGGFDSDKHLVWNSARKVSEEEKRAKSLSRVIVHMAMNTNEYTDFSGIYCVKCDFSGVEIQNANFSDALLSLSNFSSSKLVSSNFEGADIEGAMFVASDLRGARFTLRKKPRGDDSIVPYNRVFRSWLNSPPVGRRLGASFNCSDLRGADFTQFPVFSFFYDRREKYLEGLSFVGADVKSANFKKSRFFGASDKNSIPFYGRNGGTLRRSGVSVFLYEFNPYFKTSDSVGEVDKADFSSSFLELKRRFSGSSWSESNLPSELEDWFLDNPPQPYMNFGFDEKCSPVSTRDGFSPKVQFLNKDSLSRRNFMSFIDYGDVYSIYMSVEWSRNAKQVAVYDLPVHERNILVGSRLFYSSQSGGALIYLIENNFEGWSNVVSVALRDLGFSDPSIFSEKLEKLGSQSFRSYSGSGMDDSFVRVLFDSESEYKRYEKEVSHLLVDLNELILDYAKNNIEELSEEMRFER